MSVYIETASGGRGCDAWFAGRATKFRDTKAIAMCSHIATNEKTVRIRCACCRRTKNEQKNGGGEKKKAELESERLSTKYSVVQLEHIARSQIKPFSSSHWHGPGPLFNWSPLSLRLVPELHEL